mgnify:CR=1 FL=1
MATQELISFLYLISLTSPKNLILLLFKDSFFKIFVWDPCEVIIKLKFVILLNTLITLSIFFSTSCLLLHKKKGFVFMIFLFE